MHEELLKGKYPAKTHAKKVGDYLKSNGGKDGIIYLEGQKTQMIEVGILLRLCDQTLQ